MKITTIGIDLAKEVFAIHGVDERGHAVLVDKFSNNEAASCSCVKDGQSSLN
jgi:transposase